MLADLKPPERTNMLCQSSITAASQPQQCQGILVLLLTTL